MPQHLVRFIAGCLALLVSEAVHAEGTCGLPLGPLAANESVALGVFNAIADGLESPAKRAKYETKVRDMQTSWTVYEALKVGQSARLFLDQGGMHMKTVQTTLGGGGLEMSVDKCSAAVSNVYFEK